MKIVDGDNDLLEGNDGETITVEVESKNTVHGVSYVRDEESGTLGPGETLSFKLNAGSHDPSKLTLTMHYIGSGDPPPAYRVRISGDAGGETLTKVYTQSFGTPVEVRRFIVDVSK